MSKAEAGLHLDDAGTQRASRLAEVRLSDVALDSVPPASAVQVDLVKQIVEIGANFKLSVFANQFQVRQAKGLAELRVDVKVAGARERVTRNRFAWQGAKALLAARALCRRRIREEASEQRSRSKSGRREECVSRRTGIAVVIRSKAAVVRRRENCA